MCDYKIKYDELKDILKYLKFFNIGKKYMCEIDNRYIEIHIWLDSIFFYERSGFIWSDRYISECFFNNDISGEYVI